MQHSITHRIDGKIRPKAHFVMLREACSPEEEEELDNIINTYDDIS
jgi:hypothetical protein